MDFYLVFNDKILQYVSSVCHIEIDEVLTLINSTVMVFEPKKINLEICQLNRLAKYAFDYNF